MNSKAKAIKNAVKQSGSTMHAGKKAAPGINYNQLTPKEKYYRKSNEQRSDKKLNEFHNSSYGKHLSAKSSRRGEED